MELWNTWVPSFGGLGLSEVIRLGESSPINMGVHIQVGVPWPISNRVCRFAVDGIDCFHPLDSPKQVVVMLDSAEVARNVADLKEYDCDAEGTVECVLFNSGVIITPEEIRTDGGKGCFLQIVCQFDPKMSVPTWLINLAVRNFCFLLMSQLRWAAEGLREREPMYMEHMTEPGHRFYSFLRRRLMEELPVEAKRTPPERQVAQIT